VATSRSIPAPAAPEYCAHAAVLLAGLAPHDALDRLAGDRRHARRIRQLAGQFPVRRLLRGRQLLPQGAQILLRQEHALVLVTPARQLRGRPAQEAGRIGQATAPSRLDRLSQHPAGGDAAIDEQLGQQVKMGEAGAPRLLLAVALFGPKQHRVAQLA